jgi:1,4-alpha-glucan branching enzyme
VVSDLTYRWGDSRWLKERPARDALRSPISVYEVHFGSWRRVPGEGNRPMTYREMAAPLIEYVQWLGFSHVEFMPLMEHPFYGSWGYQTTGYFAPTSRFGTPQDLMYLIDQLHQAGIGVILDWVPSHFPSDEHGLANFDGTSLYEHADPRQGYHPDWHSSIFNYGRHEVRSFLLSSGMFWMDQYHADGLRVDAVASMLYLDYSRKPGEWIPNRYGGRENLDAIAFLRRLNQEVYAAFPGAQTIAEESTSWPGVSRPNYLGGLGFGFKWDMGWMHDTLAYLSRDPVHRRFHHSNLTFRGLYAFHENFVLPLSHDEVVHGKGSLIQKMAGDEWQKRANLRLLFSTQWATPGKKLLFMGMEFGQWREWNHDSSLDWHLTNEPGHAGLQLLVADLNALYRRERPLHELDAEPQGFEWIDANDSNQSVASFLRTDKDGNPLLVVLNYTPVVRVNYRVGVPRGGQWREILNSDATVYGGSGMGNYGVVLAHEVASHGRPFSLDLTLPPLSAVFFKPAG